MDINTAKNEATLMLQSHGINTSRNNDAAMDLEASKNGKSKVSLGNSSQGNLFNKKKDNLEDKARIVELIQ